MSLWSVGIFLGIVVVMYGAIAFWLIRNDKQGR